MGERAWRRVLVSGAALLAVAGCRPADILPATTSARPPQRVVSMAPSLTEVLYALGLGDRVVGVTQFCDYPPEAKLLPKVGGYLDPSWEALVALEPDLVLLMQDHAEAQDRLRQLKIPTLRVDQSSVTGILGSIAAIAHVCGVEERGRRLVADVNERLEKVAAATADLSPQRVLVVVGREAGTGRVSSVWVAGPHTFYDDVVRYAGGVNACEVGAAAYPEISREGLIHIDPDVIVDVLPDLSRQGVAPETATADWASCGELAAVKAGRVRILTQDFAEIPGPRVADLVEAMARALHPEAS